MARTAESVMVLNDYGLQRRSRTLKSGAVKERLIISIESEPIVIGVDPKALTKAPAEAIAEHFRKSIEAISEQVSPRTIRQRAVNAKAVADGKAWAVRRYSGGRIGSMPPNQSDRLFNDSGRFARSIAVGATSDGWVINVAANRLDSATATEAALVRMFEMLRQRVPGWGNARELAQVVSVKRAIRDVTSSMLRKATERTVELEIQKMRAVMGAVGQVARALAGLAG